MKTGKPGRNDPCPCGSGKKYKKCCLLAESSRVPVSRLPREVEEAVRARAEAAQVRRARFGEVRPAIHSDFQGHKFVAVGNQLHYSRDWRTFPDFLQAYIRSILGSDWGNAELAKPLDARDEIMKWYDTMWHFLQAQEPGTDGLCGVIPNGATRAWLLLAYDLYVLRHHSALQESLVRRLKQPRQFQGARHELFAAATCIRAGFDIAFEDETDATRRHVEFTATHRPTGQQIDVEAKSRHRPGVLGHPEHPTGSREVRAGIARLLNDALRKPFTHPYVIFFDLNLPPSPEPLRDKPWFAEIRDSLDRVPMNESADDRFNLIVFTNQPDHYGKHECPAPSGNVFSVLSSRPQIAATHMAALAAVHHAADQYGAIPNAFEEAE